MLTQIRPQDFDLSIGIDTSKKSYAITYMDHDRKSKSLMMPAKPQKLHHYFQRQFPQKRLLYIYEAGPTGYELYDYLRTQHQTCLVVHPASIAQASNQRVKNNRIDSQKLSQQGLNAELQSIRVPEEAYRQLRHLATLRQDYAKDQRRAKQRIKSLVLFESLKLPESLEADRHWSARYRACLSKLQVPNESVGFRLQSLLEDLDHAQQRLLKVHRQMRAFSTSQAAVVQQLSYLRSIPGLGFVVSIYLLARIGNPEHLRNVREIGCFAGLTPREHSTGENINQGSISHMGDGMLRSLLVQAAWIAIRKDKPLSQFFDRIRSRHHSKGASQIAIVAVARKLTMRIYRVLKDQRPYVSFQ